MKAVVFDFNGTLFKDQPKHVQAWSAVSMMLRQIPITEKELKEDLNGKRNAQILEYLKGEPLDFEESERLSRLKEEYYRRFCLEDEPGLRLTEGAEELFDRLKEQGIPMTIASASIWENIAFFIQTFGLDRWFDPAKIVWDDGSYADKKAMIEQCAKILQTEPADLTVFEDSAEGIRCAIAAGCRDVRVINSNGIPLEQLQHPAITRICRDMTEIEL